MITKVDFQSFYKEFIPVFNEEYRKSILNEKPFSLYDPIKYVLHNPGKQIRPAILGAIASSSNSIDHKELFPAAICIEMVHNFTLIHDDIMDNDLVRHGKQTVHSKWNMNKAILSGDGFFAMALKQLDHYASSPIIYSKISPIILEAVIIVCEGQAMDMEFEERNDVSLTEYIEMVEKKTAWLLAVSARIGAILADTAYKDQLLIEEIIKRLGVVFQIQDDLLELTSDTKTMGKSLGSDLVKQKKTYPYLYAKQELNGKKWTEFQKVISEDVIRESGIEPAREILRNNFIFDRINEVITLQHVDIKELINELPPEKRDVLNSIVNYILNRKY